MREPAWEISHSIWLESELAFSSRLIFVEARSALTRARRARRLNVSNLERARSGLELLLASLAVIELGPRVQGLAGDVAETLGLRAHDAIHLASALAVGDPELVFASWDGELRRAAARTGLAVAPAYG